MKVKVRDARYAGTIYNPLPDLPEVAFAGRSNVGKSSLINALLGRKGLVKTSKQPGKTRNVNYFQVDLVDEPSLHMVDLPGYGYAQVSREMRQSWRGLVNRYLVNNQNLKLMLVLVDLRRDLKEEEMLALRMVRDLDARALVICTKADKLGRAEHDKRVRALAGQSGGTIMVTSAAKGSGLEPVWNEILGAIRPPR